MLLQISCALWLLEIQFEAAILVTVIVSNPVCRWIKYKFNKCKWSCYIIFACKFAVSTYLTCQASHQWNKQKEQFGTRKLQGATPSPTAGWCLHWLDVPVRVLFWLMNSLSDRPLNCRNYFLAIFLCHCLESIWWHCYPRRVPFLGQSSSSWLTNIQHIFRLLYDYLLFCYIKLRLNPGHTADPYRYTPPDEKIMCGDCVNGIVTLSFFWQSCLVHFSATLTPIPVNLTNLLSSYSENG
jgi:hypothetical protein